MALSSLESTQLDLTLVRPSARLRRVRAAGHKPVAVLLAGCVLSGAFLVAVSDVVSRLG